MEGGGVEENIGIKQQGGGAHYSFWKLIPAIASFGKDLSSPFSTLYHIPVIYIGRKTLQVVIRTTFFNIHYVHHERREPQVKEKDVRGVFVQRYVISYIIMCKAGREGKGKAQYSLTVPFCSKSVLFSFLDIDTIVRYIMLFTQRVKFDFFKVFFCGIPKFLPAEILVNF